MTFFYVKDDGAAIDDAGRYATKQTGSFATLGSANYYASIDAANGATHPPADGDFIFCSDVHSFDYVSNKLMALATGVTIVSVDDTAINIYKAGAFEYSSTGYLSYEGRYKAIGMTFGAYNKLYFRVQSGATNYEKCTFDFVAAGATSDGSNININKPGFKGFYVDCDFRSPDVAYAYPFYITNGSQIHVIGGSILSNTNKPEYLVYCYSGAYVLCENVDLSNMKSGFNIVKLRAEAYAHTHTVILKNCKLPASWNFSAETIYPPTRIELYNCDSANKYVMAIKDGYGNVTVDTSVYRSALIESQDLSFTIDTSSRAKEFSLPFRFLLSELRADFSTAKNVDVHFVNDGTTYQDDEVWIEVHVPAASGPGKVIYRSRAADILATPANLPTSSETWYGTGGFTTEVKQYARITTAGSEGNGECQVFLCVAKPSVSNLYVCPVVEIA